MMGQCLWFPLAKVLAQHIRKLKSDLRSGNFTSSSRIELKELQVAVLTFLRRVSLAAKDLPIIRELPPRWKIERALLIHELLLSLPEAQLGSLFAYLDV